VGHRAAPWQEQLVSMGLGIGAICILVACCFVIYGLRSSHSSDVRVRPLMMLVRVVKAVSASRRRIRSSAFRVQNATTLQSARDVCSWKSFIPPIVQLAISIFSPIPRASAQGLQITIFAFGFEKTSSNLCGGPNGTIF
jgi:hypothetical protein